MASVSVLAMLTVATMSVLGLESASAGKRAQKAKANAVNKVKVKGGGGDNRVVVRAGDASANAECEINQNNVGVVRTMFLGIGFNDCPATATGGVQTINPPPNGGGLTITFPAAGPITQSNTASGNSGNLAG